MRQRRQAENDEYAAFVRRILRAYARRVGDGDAEARILMTDLGGRRVTWAAYGQDLEASLQGLHARVQQGRYRASPSRRVQRAVVEVLNAALLHCAIPVCARA